MKMSTAAGARVVVAAPMGTFSVVRAAQDSATATASLSPPTKLPPFEVTASRADIFVVVLDSYLSTAGTLRLRLVPIERFQGLGSRLTRFHIKGGDDEDIVQSIDGHSVDGMTEESFTELLLRNPKPVVLTVRGALKHETRTLTALRESSDLRVRP